MAGKADGNIIGYKYFLGMHLALCKSADKLVNIIINNRVLYGSPQVTHGLYDPTTGEFPDNSGQDILTDYSWVASKDGIVHTKVITKGDIVRPVQTGMVFLLYGNQVLNSVARPTDWKNPDRWESVPREAVTSSQDITITKGDLFGGDTREGGISGTLGIAFGEATQGRDPYLEDQWGADFTPAFRGIFTVIVKGMYIGLNPYLKNWEFLLQRTPCLGWYDTKATILSSDGYEDTNPAHIVRELLVNHGGKTSWGLRYPTSVVNDTQFRASADKLYEEGFGLSLAWEQQETTEALLQKVLNHVSGVLRLNPLSGLFELKLIRKDHYLEGEIWKDSTGNNLLHFNESNSTLMDYQSVGWGETINEVTVRYAQRWSGKAQSVTVQDIANMQIQGQVVAQTQDFLGITNGDLAAKVAKMQLQVVSTPLSKIDIEVNREGFSLLQGDVFIFSSVKKGIDKAFYRVGDIAKGRVGDGKISIKAVLDVFSLPADTYIMPERIGWANPDVTAVPAANIKFIEQCFWDVVYSQGGGTASSQDDGTSLLIGMAARPKKGVGHFDMYVNTEVSGTGSYLKDSKGYFCPFAKLLMAVTQQVSSTLYYSDEQELEKLTVGSYGYLGDELIKVSSINLIAKTLVVDRGLLDTVPTAHAIGTPLFFYGTYVAETGKYSSGSYAALSRTEVVEDPTHPYFAKFTPIASTNKLGVTDESILPITYNAVGRINLPYPVGNVKVNSVRYPVQAASSGSLLITFSRRNGHQMTPIVELQSSNHLGDDEEEVYYVIKVYYGSTLKRTTLFPYPDFTGLSKATTGVFTYDYTMAMQDVDLAGVFGYVSGAALSADTTITISSHRLSDDESYTLDNFQTQTLVFRRNL